MSPTPIRTAIRTTRTGPDGIRTQEGPRFRTSGLSGRFETTGATISTRRFFVTQIEKPDGTIQEGKDRAEDFFDKVEQAARDKATSVLEKRDLIRKAVIDECIDVRAFGATIPVASPKKNGKKNGKDSSVTLTGPVQFAMASSLNETEPRFIKGTGAFASGQGAQQKTFREEYVLPYALIAFYGIVNQQAAETTEMTVADAEALYEGIWYGTKNLITRSKIGQRPLLMLLVEYSDPKAYIGRLDRYLRITKTDCRDISEVKLDLSDLAEALKTRRSAIQRIRFAHDPRAQITPDLKAESWGDNLLEDLAFL